MNIKQTIINLQNKHRINLHKSLTFQSLPKLILITSCLSIIFLFIISGFALYSDYSTEMRLAKQNIENMVSIYYNNVKLTISNIKDILQTISTHMLQTQRQNNSKSWDLPLTSYDMQIIHHLFVLDLSGTVIYSNSKFTIVGEDLSHENVYKTHLGNNDNTFFIDMPNKNSFNPNWDLPISYAVKNKQGELQAIIVALIKPIYFVKLFATLALRAGDCGMVIHKGGNIISTYPFDDKLIGESIANTKIYKQFISTFPLGSVQSKTEDDRRYRLIAFRTISPWPLIVTFSIQKNEVLESFYKNAISWSCVVVMLLIATIFIARFHFRQANHIVNQTVELEKSTEALTLALEDLRKNEQRLKKAQKIGRIGDWEYDLSTRSFRMSEMVINLLEIIPTHTQLTYDDLIQTYYLEDQEKLNQHFDLVFLTGKQVELDVIASLPSQKTACHHLVITPIKDDTGKNNRILGIIQDITNRKIAEKELEMAHKRLAFHIHNSPLGLIEWNKDLQVKSWSSQAEKIFGWKSDEVIGKRWDEWEFIYHGQLDAVNAIADRLLNGTEERNISSGKNYAKNGTYVFTEWYNSALLDDTGTLISIFSLVQNVSRRKKAEKALKQAHAKLQEYSVHLEEMVARRTKDLQEAQEVLIRQEKLAVLGQMAGGIGHELRNPLSIISNALYVIQLSDPIGYNALKEYLDIIADEVQKAQDIISDLLDFARIQSVKRSRVDITALIREVLKKITVSDNITVNISVPSTVPMVFVDALKMEQVFKNLFQNACQAMPNGGELSIIIHHENLLVYISIVDTGVGIDSDKLGKIFEPLFTTKAQGIGLGLSLTKSFVEVNGGTIEVDSTPGVGTRFKVLLPVYKKSLE